MIHKKLSILIIPIFCVLLPVPKLVLIIAQAGTAKDRYVGEGAYSFIHVRIYEYGPPNYRSYAVPDKKLQNNVRIPNAYLSNYFGFL